MLHEIVGELLSLVESIVRTHHSWTGEITHEAAIQQVDALKNKLNVAIDNQNADNTAEES